MWGNTQCALGENMEDLDVCWISKETMQRSIKELLWSIAWQQISGAVWDNKYTLLQASLVSPTFSEVVIIYHSAHIWKNNKKILSLNGSL